MQTITIGNNQAGQRFDKYLHKLMPSAGTGFLYKMLRKKNITLNGKKAEGAEILSVGDKVSFFFSDETFAKFTENQSVKTSEKGTLSSNSTQSYEKAFHSLKGIQILYEDSNFIFLEKPAGILTQKAQPSDLTLNEWLIGYLLSQDSSWAEELKTFHPSVCNRLDRNTSGIVLCGKSLAGSQFLSKCIKERTVRKFYRTICVGKITSSSYIKGYLKKDSSKNKVTIQKSASKTADDSYIETGYSPITWNQNYTYLEVELITGKTHQIRAHLSQEGYPLIGDYKYGNQALNDRLKKTYHLSNQLLHAYRVEFPHFSDEIGHNISEKTFISACPKQFQTILAGLALKED